MATRPKPAPAPALRTGDPRTDTTVPNPVEDGPSPKERAEADRPKTSNPATHDGPPPTGTASAVNAVLTETHVNPVSGHVIEVPVEAVDSGETKTGLDLVRALWYGDPGKGKTTAMCTLANLGKVVLWDAENRLKQSALRRAGVNVDNIERVTAVSYREMSDRLDAMADRDDLLGVLFDGGTELTRVLVQHLVDEGVRTAARKGMERSEWRTYQDDYGDATEQMRRLLRKAFRLDCHFGMTCLAQRTTDETKGVRVSPQFTPAIARDVNSSMDIVGYLRVDEVGDDIVRSALFEPVGPFEAKDTFGVLPRRLANPTFERILRYVYEDLNAESDPEQQRAGELIAKATVAEAAKAEQ
jgi:hypothetical protein